MFNSGEVGTKIESRYERTMKIEHHKFLCRQLFIKGDRDSLCDRAAFSLDWSLLSRWTEVAAIEQTDMKWHKSRYACNVKVNL